MGIPKTVKMRVASFLVMWFAGKLNTSELLASALEELAEFIRSQQEVFSQVDKS